jgi:hypothetical protein
MKTAGMASADQQPQVQLGLEQNLRPPGQILRNAFVTDFASTGSSPETCFQYNKQTFVTGEMIVFEVPRFRQKSKKEKRNSEAPFPVWEDRQTAISGFQLS